MTVHLRFDVLGLLFVAAAHSQELRGWNDFVAQRTRRASSIRTYCLSHDDPNSPRATTNETQSVEWPTAEAIRTGQLLDRSPREAPLRREEDFVSGHLSSCYSFWADVVLTNHPQRDTLLGWLQGVRISDFVDLSATGTFQGREYAAAELTPVELANHVPPQHDAWVDAEVVTLVERGSIALWADVADVAAHPVPAMSLPLGVEPDNSRLFWDGTWLNLMCRRMPFRLDGVGEVAKCSWRGAHQITMGHASGLHHVPLHPDSWKYFGFRWKGKYYVWTVVCFGWCSSPYVYHTLSDAVAQYLQSRDVPMLACIDDFWMAGFRSARDLAPEKQAKAARTAAYLALSIFYHCGYFMSMAKCQLEPTTRIVFLGVTCDTDRCRFEVPEDKLAEMESILTRAVSAGVISPRPSLTWGGSKPP